MHILLVRLRLIGDVVFTTPLVSALKQHTGARISYVVEPAAAPVLQANPAIDDLLVVARTSGLTRLRDDAALGRRLRRAQVDVAIDLHGGPRSSWLTWASGAAMRIGNRTPGRSWMYTHPVERVDDLVPRHSVVNQWDLLGPLGIPPPDPSRDPVVMPEDPATAARVAERLRAAGVGAGNPLVLMHVSAGNAFRRWPPSSFVQAITALAARDTRRRIILTSGPSDAAAAASIARAAREILAAPECVPVTGEWDLPELRALIARAAVYIGGDSGPAHIAATTATPIVELLGPTLAERSRPWRDPSVFVETIDAGALPCRPCRQRHCEPGDFRCLGGITPEQVVEAAERALASPRAPESVRRPPAPGERSGRQESGVHA